MGAELLELEPEAVPTARDRLALTPGEARLLATDGPFFRTGRARAFADIREGHLGARMVASIDARQRDAAGPVGCLGFVRLDGDPVGAASVLVAGISWLRAQQVAVVRCPVQLSTWYGHRTVTGGFPDEGGVPAFPLEPVTDRALLALLESNGFAPAHRAVSCLVDPGTVVADTDRVLGRLRAAGIRDRAIRIADLGQELGLLHRLSLGIFHGAWGLSPVTADEFSSIYRPLAEHVDPELVRIVEDADGQALGFALALAGGDHGAFILKSIGVTEAARRAYPGLGGAVAGIVHRVALDRGYTRGIHALMAVGSAAHRTSLRWGEEIRSYATFDRLVT